MMARVVSKSGGTPVLVDASRRMLLAAGSELMVQAAFEALPFRDWVFGSVVAGFSLEGLAGPLRRGRRGEEGNCRWRQVRPLRPRQAGLLPQGGRPRRVHPRRLGRSCDRCCHRREDRARFRLPLRHLPPYNEERIPLGAPRRHRGSPRSTGRGRGSWAVRSPSAAPLELLYSFKFWARRTGSTSATGTVQPAALAWPPRFRRRASLRSRLSSDPGGSCTPTSSAGSSRPSRPASPCRRRPPPLGRRVAAR